MKISLRELSQSRGTRVKRNTLKVRSFPVGLLTTVEVIFVSIVRAWASEISSVVVPQYSQPLATDGAPEAMAALGLVNERNAQILVYQTEKLGRWVTRVGEWNRSGVISAVRSAVGVDINPYLTMEEVGGVLELGIRDGASKLRSLDSEMRGRVEALVFKAFTERWTKKRFVDELAILTETTKKKARRRARDFASMIQSVLDEYRYGQLGLDEYVWRTMEDDKVRAAHASRDGRVVKWSSPPYDGHAGRPPGCRCRPEALLWK